MLHDPAVKELFPKLTEEALEKLESIGDLAVIADGEKLFEQGQPVDFFYALLSGQVRVVKTMAGSEVLLTIHQPGEFTGDMSTLCGAEATATGLALGEVRAIKVENYALLQLVAERSAVGKMLLSAMAARALDTTAQLQHQEKMASLGKLSAGLAHELNNPAAAARSASARLGESLQASQTESLQYDCRLQEEQRVGLRALLVEAIQFRGEQRTVDALEQSDRECDLSEWLDHIGMERSWELSPVLVAAGLTKPRIQELLGRDERIVGIGIVWLERSLTLMDLTSVVEQSSIRIAELVKAMKEYSHMDEAAQQQVDIHRGIESTVRILQHKLKNIELKKEFDRALPQICAYPSELNQVWTNLLDNAIDAMKGQGKLLLRTSNTGEALRVDVVDNGPGIPKELQSRIFEPFFTTKKIGEGTGLGLDIVYRIVKRHKGVIRLESRPGETRFTIELPLQAEKECA